MADKKTTELTENNSIDDADEVITNVDGVTSRTSLAALKGHARSGLTAAESAVTPTGDIAATDVQGALAELDSEKAAASHSHAISDVVSLQDSLDIKAEGVKTLTASSGVSFAIGEVGYVEFGTEEVKAANASAEATAVGMLVIAIEAVSGGASGKFAREAEVSGLSSLVDGVIYLGTTDKAMTQTAPASTGEIIRVIGRALTASKMFFNPSPSWGVKS